MVLEKDEMLKLGNGYVSAVTAAQELCNSSAKKLSLPIDTISQNWGGDSGTAMAQVLAELQAELVNIGIALASVGKLMSEQVRFISDAWAEEDVKEG